jgi:hypothetical protein
MRSLPNLTILTPGVPDKKPFTRRIACPEGGHQWRNSTEVSDPLQSSATVCYRDNQELYRYLLRLGELLEERGARIRGWPTAGGAPVSRAQY